MKCPHCDKPILQVSIQPVTGSVPFGSQWNCIAFVCALCQNAISMQIDPIAIKTDIVNELMKRLRSTP